MKITDFLQNHIVVLDGGMGTLLQEQGLAAGDSPERWNLTNPQAVGAIHAAYFNAGSHVVNTNTFGANRLKFPAEELQKIVTEAVRIAKDAARQSEGDHPKWVALDIGPTGRLLKPLGDLDFEEAVSIFAETVRLGAKAGADLIMIETMNDCYETKAALLAAKENSDLPVFVSNAYGENGRLMTGADPLTMTAMLEGMGADAIGMNCSFGPDQSAPVAEEYLRIASVPVLLKPNAGLPHAENGRAVYDIGAEAFADLSAALVQKGVRIVGGCCGTTPAYIRALTEKIQGVSPKPIRPKSYTAVSSFSRAVVIGEHPVLIGERINPTGKKRFKEALQERDMAYILHEGVKEAEAGAHILDVNVGLPGLDEKKMLTDAVCELQSVTELPLQIDTSSPAAMEAALRRYNGKAMVNSVNGKQESMQAIFPLVKKYGGVVVALTLDENGIPATAEGRLAIAKKIVQTAAGYGIEKKNIVVDTLVMAVSAAPDAAAVTLESVQKIRRELGVPVSLGISNISFGLPERGTVNAVFFAQALQSGLSAAIMNPFSEEMMKTYYAHCLLAGQDRNCAAYIAFAESHQAALPTVTDGTNETLEDAVIKGLKERAAALAEARLQTAEPLAVVNENIIPALDQVGKLYESGTVYLPQLLMSAEAAKAAFEKVKEKIGSGGSRSAKCRFVIATVRGDIHDIGKNIVRLLLENYGFEVTDLGKDVPPETVVETVVRLHAPLAGLSALMTTTVPAMEETIRQLKEQAPWCRTVVGGAVMTKEYADSIGADRYAKDAMDTVRYAEEIFEGLQKTEHKA